MYVVESHSERITSQPAGPEASMHDTSKTIKIQQEDAALSHASWPTTPPDAQSSTTLDQTSSSTTLEQSSTSATLHQTSSSTTLDQTPAGADAEYKCHHCSKTFTRRQTLEHHETRWHHATMPCV